jgi:hypothetical protein
MNNMQERQWSDIFSQNEKSAYYQKFLRETQKIGSSEDEGYENNLNTAMQSEYFQKLANSIGLTAKEMREFTNDFIQFGEIQDKVAKKTMELEIAEKAVANTIKTGDDINKSTIQAYEEKKAALEENGVSLEKEKEAIQNNIAA